LALTIGVIVGTYSSVFIASPLVIKIDDFLAKRRLQAQGRGQAQAT
jgi:preprotein translocase subunit SecF